MKTVFLFRHGDSQEIGYESDYSRELTEKGTLITAEMARHLKESGVRPDLIITSGAVRAMSTAVIAAAVYGSPEPEIVVEDVLYYSREEADILHMIQKSPAEMSSIMIVGHEPLFSDFVSYISSTPSDISMKKSSVVRVDFNTDKWSSIAIGSGIISFYKIFSGGKIIDEFTCVQE